MKVKIPILLLILSLYSGACSRGIVNRSFVIHAGNSYQTAPSNDSCYTKHIDIVHFTNENQQLYYREVYICKTKGKQTIKEETRLGETFTYSMTGNKIITPDAVYDTLEIRGRKLRTKYGFFMRPLSAKKAREYRNVQ